MPTDPAALVAMIEKELQEIEVLRQALRARAMIYDADRKDLVAAHYHLDR